MTYPQHYYIQSALYAKGQLPMPERIPLPPPVPKGLPAAVHTFDAALFRHLDGVLSRVQAELLFHPRSATAASHRLAEEVREGSVELARLWMVALESLPVPQSPPRPTPFVRKGKTEEG